MDIGVWFDYTPDKYEAKRFEILACLKALPFSKVYVLVNPSNRQHWPVDKLSDLLNNLGAVCEGEVLVSIVVPRFCLMCNFQFTPS